MGELNTHEKILNQTGTRESNEVQAQEIPISYRHGRTKQAVAKGAISYRHKRTQRATNTNKQARQSATSYRHKREPNELKA
jgi:hypothetical protein